MIINEPPRQQEATYEISPKQHGFHWWWTQFFQQVYLVCFSQQQSGPSTSRPRKNLWIGRRYFDTDLQSPMWVAQVKPDVIWVGASGSPVVVNNVVVTNELTDEDIQAIIDAFVDGQETVSSDHPLIFTSDSGSPPSVSLTTPKALVVQDLGNDQCRFWIGEM